MKFMLSQIRKKAHTGPYEFDDYVDISDIVHMNNDVQHIKPVRVAGNCTIQGEQFYFRFTIEGEATLPDARTLEEVVYPFRMEATEIFSSSAKLDSDDEQEEIHPVDGEVIDLTPYIKENVLLGLPYRVYAEEGTGNVLTSGEGWNFISEEEKEKTVDPRLQILETLLEKKPEEK